MPLNLETPRNKPPRILIYGPAGVGKTRFGYNALDPVFIQTEDGLDALEDVKAFPLAHSFAEVMSAIGDLYEQEHQFKTVVVDSVDWLESLIHRQVCKEKNVDSLADINYGKGYTFALDMFQQYIDGLNALRDDKDMTVIQIAHSEIKRYENPETDGYDRYQIKLHKGAADKLMEHSDVVLFANHYVTTVKKKEGFSEKTKAKGSGERVLYTQEKPAYYAKSRYDMPSEIPFDKDGEYWGILAQSIPYYSSQMKGHENGES